MVPVKAYSYTRMSSKRQMKGDSLERQQQKARDAANEFGWVLDDSMRDIGVSGYSGKNIKDGALGAFINLCNEGEIEKGSVLIIENLDRFSRLKPTEAFNIFTSLLKTGVDIYICDDRKHFTEDNVDNDIGSLFMSIGSMFRARDESQRKAERLASAWEKKRAKAGKEKITKTCPAWMKLSKNRKSFALIPERVKVIKYIHQICQEGFGYVTIARRLHEEGIQSFSNGKGWHSSTIQNILVGKTVIGHYQPNTVVGGKRKPIGDLVENYYPAAIDEATYYKSQKEIASRNFKRTGRKGKTCANLFSGLVKCNECGGSLIYQDTSKPNAKKRYKRLRCYNAPRGICSNRTFHGYDKLEHLVLANLSSLSVANLSNPKQSERKNILEMLDVDKGKLKTIKARKKKLLDRYGDEGDETIDEHIKEMGVKESELKKTIAELSESLKKVSLPTEKTSEVIDNIHAYHKMMKGADEKEMYRVRTMIAVELKKIIGSIKITTDGTAYMNDKITGDSYYIGGTSNKPLMIDGIPISVAKFIVNEVDKE